MSNMFFFKIGVINLQGMGLHSMASDDVCATEMIKLTILG